MALFTMGTGGHYITMLPADRSTCTSHNVLALQFLWCKCYGVHLYQASAIAEHTTGTRQSTGKANTVVHTLYTCSHGFLGDG